MSRSTQAWLQFAIAAIGVAAFFLLLRGSGGGGHSAPDVPAGNRVAAEANLHRPPESVAAEARSPVAADPDPGPAEEPSLEGDWAARGEVQWVDPGVNSTQPPGTILNRPWSFQEICRASCRVAFARGT